MRACCRQAAEYPCDMCNVVTSSEEQLAVHMDGKRHRKHILMAEITSSSTADVGADGDELHCELCDVTAPSSTHKQIHLRCLSHMPHRYGSCLALEGSCESAAWHPFWVAHTALK